MRMTRIGYLTTIAVVIIGATCSAFGMRAEARTSPAETAIRAAAKQHRYMFVTFYKKNDAASTKMLEEAKKLQSRYSNRANFISVDIKNASDQGVISRYGANRSPIPLTIVIAPNGAVTAGFPNEINRTDLSDVFVSQGEASVLKVLQSGKLAAVCIQSSRTKNNKESLAAAKGLKSDQFFAGAVEIVKINSSDRSEAKFIRQCKADVNSTNAQLVILTPPGKIVAKFDGATDKSTVVATLMKSFGGGCSGGTCGPGGCGK